MSKTKNEILKNRNFTVVSKDDLPGTGYIDLYSRTLPKLSPSESLDLKSAKQNFKAILEAYPPYFYQNILEGANQLTEYILVSGEKYMDNGQSWLAFTIGFFGLIELFYYLKDNRTEETQELILLIRDFLSTLLSHQDDSFLMDAAAYLLKSEESYPGKDDLDIQETLSSILLNRIIDTKEIAGVLLNYIEAELKKLEQHLSPEKANYFKLSDIIGRFYAIKLDIMFNFEPNIDEITAFYQENYDKPYLSQSYFRNLFEKSYFDLLYSELKTYSKSLKHRFDAFTLFFRHSEYYAILNSLIKLMILLDEIQDYFSFLIKEFLTERYKSKDLEEITLILKEYVPDPVYTSLIEFILENDEIPVSAKADFFEGLQEYNYLLKFALSDSVYFEKYFDTLYKIYPEEIQDKLIQDYYLEQPASMKSRNQYKQIIARLEDLKEDFGEKNKIEEVVAYWRKTFPRKTALKDELEKAGY